MAALYEQYRPQTWEEVIGQDAAVQKVQVLKKRGLNGRVFWIRGESGHGKTTIARLIAQEVATPTFTLEMDAQDLKLEVVRDLEAMCRYRPLEGQAHCFIVNEAHTLLKWCVARLLTVFEERHVQRNSVWVFTTTSSAQKKMFDSGVDASPFLSRSIEIELESGGSVAAAFALKCQEVAAKEGLDGRPIADYESLAMECRGNLRQMFQKVEAGEMIA